MNDQAVAAILLGTLYIGGLTLLNNKVEQFGDVSPVSRQMPQRQPYPNYKTNPPMYRGSGVASNKPYAGPNAGIPQSRTGVSLTASGDQMLDYQLFQQAVNASTPTNAQLASVSGDSDMQTGMTADQLKGGLSQDYAPYDTLSSNGPQLYTSEFQAVNIGNQRAQSISACAQNAPSFVATSLLPKPTIPGQASWDIGAPQNVLANQDFLSATQQIGVDTVLSSNKIANQDIRGTIPNPINVVSPWMQSSVLPSLQQRPLTTYIPDQGLYSCGPAGCGENGYYIGGTN